MNDYYFIDQTATAVKDLSKTLEASTNNQSFTTSDGAAWFAAIGTVALTIFEAWKYYHSRPRLILEFKQHQTYSMDFDDYYLKDKATDRGSWVIIIRNPSSKPIHCNKIVVFDLLKEDPSFPVDHDQGVVRPFTVEPYSSTFYMFSDSFMNPKEISYVGVEDELGKVHRKKFNYKTYSKYAKQYKFKR